MMKFMERLSATPEAGDFRRAMRAWTTGVGVLMSAHEGEAYGITINSLASLSLDPPLVTVVLMNDSFIYRLVTGSHAFSVTLLSADQQALADLIWKSGQATLRLVNGNNPWGNMYPLTHQ